MNDMDSTLEEILRAPTDYSAAFTSEVDRLAERAGQALGAPVEHGRDMNYASSQRLVVGIDAAGRPVPALGPSSVAKVVAYVSSKGKVFAVHTFEARTGSRALKEWLPTAKYSGGSEVVQKLSSTLEAQGYRRIAGPVLEQLADGHVTEMDGAPATVFDVLFAEIE
jgi:hypothetical protein